MGREVVGDATEQFVRAQASVEGWPLLTRDARICRGFFPDVGVVGVN
jgi:hypothetical protein